jgi:hypothetical protein
MRGVTVTLPPVVEAKLQALTVARDLALDATRSCVARLSGLGRDFDPQLQARLASERDRHNAKHTALSTLIHKLNQFLVELRLPPGAVLEPVQPVSIRLAEGETVNEAITKVRAEIAALNRQLVTVKAAVLPKLDQIGAAEAFVAKMASVSRPTVAILRDDMLRVSWRDSVISGTDDVLSMLCWIMPEAVVAALTRDIEAQPTPINPMSRADRLQKVGELSAACLEHELIEESLIELAAREGVEIMRRPDIANLNVVLGVVVVAKKTQAQTQEVVA